MKRLLTLAVVLSFVVSCATPAQQAKTEGTAGGAAIGAGMGALAGYLIGGSGTAAAIGAVTGGILGAAAGYSYANNIVKRQKELAGRENDLDARIKFARGVNQDTEEYNRKLEEEIKSEEQQISRLTSGVGDQQRINQQREALRKNLANKVEDANKQLTVAKAQLEDIRSFRSRQSQSSQDLNAEISKLQITVAQLESKTQTLAGMGQRM
jgi:peptidoglycan hydrolase CwlO-like protein